jgi:DNA-binding NtrC family response regulator
MKETILIIDDEPAQLRSTEYAIQQKLFYNTLTAQNTEEAVQFVMSAETPPPDVVLLDLAKPGSQGLQVIRRIKSCRPQLPIIVLTQYGDDEYAAQVIQAGGNDFLNKPVGLERLKLSIQNALKIQRMSSLIARLERKCTGIVSFADIIGSHSLMRAALMAAQTATTSKKAVLIEGENGTGKELLAQAIHGNSDRFGKPFIVIDCERLTDHEAEAFVFGQENFLGQMHSPGKLREADQGTLFLREISALKPALQHRLLEVLQEGLITPIGASEPVPVDIRIICSTSKNLELFVRDGLFSHMLFRHINRTAITLPALRNRREDIPQLANYFLMTHTARENKFISRFSEDALEALLNNAWPGNISQLSSLIWRCTILCNHDTIDAGTLRLIQQLEPVHYASRTNTATSDAPSLVDMQGQIKKLRSIEEDAIRFALRSAGGCMTRAARSLGIGRSTLYRRLSEMLPEDEVYTSRENQTMRPTTTVSSDDLS